MTRARAAKPVAIAAAIALFAGACSDGPGSGAGRVAIIAAATIAAVIVANEIGKAMGNRDIFEMMFATGAALDGPDAQPVDWNNPDSGLSGTITPHPPTRQLAGREVSRFAPGTQLVCRLVDRTLTRADGGVLADQVRYCRTPTGPWEPVDLID